MSFSAAVGDTVLEMGGNSSLLDELRLLLCAGSSCCCLITRGKSHNSHTLWTLGPKKSATKPCTVMLKLQVSMNWTSAYMMISTRALRNCSRSFFGCWKPALGAPLWSCAAPLVVDLFGRLLSPKTINDLANVS